LKLSFFFHAGRIVSLAGGCWVAADLLVGTCVEEGLLENTKIERSSPSLVARPRLHTNTNANSSTANVSPPTLSPDDRSALTAHLQLQSLLSSVSCLLNCHPIIPACEPCINVADTCAIATRCTASSGTASCPTECRPCRAA
jgi:hypothetical protein